MDEFDRIAEDAFERIEARKSELKLALRQLAELVREDADLFNAMKFVAEAFDEEASYIAAIAFLSARCIEYHGISVRPERGEVFVNGQSRISGGLGILLAYVAGLNDGASVRG